MLRTPALSVSLAVAALAIPADAGAAMIGRTLHFNAPAYCQAALPVFDGVIRKRPLALQNEGTSAAYVTCAIPSQGELTYLNVFGSSHDGDVHRVTCTAISGTKGEGYYVVRSTLTPSDGGTVAMAWNGTLWGRPLVDPAGLPNYFIGPYLAVSCLLPPGSGLNNFEVFYQEEIGT